MKPSTRIAIASLLAALGDAFKAFAAEIGSTGTPATPEAPQAETAKPKKQKAAAAAPVETPATLVSPESPDAETPGEPAANGKTYEDMRALIEPLVKNGQGADVKKVIAKYSPEGGLKAMDPKHYAAFEKDLAAIEY